MSPGLALSVENCQSGAKADTSISVPRILFRSISSGQEAWSTSGNGSCQFNRLLDSFQGRFTALDREFSRTANWDTVGNGHIAQLGTKSRGTDNPSCDSGPLSGRARHPVNGSGLGSSASDSGPGLGYTIIGADSYRYIGASLIVLGWGSRRIYGRLEGTRGNAVATSTIPFRSSGLHPIPVLYTRHPI